ncbi:MAG: hypothetical protein WBR18_00310 [Anaerolineales bacterium]
MANPVSVEVYTTSHRVLGRIQPGSAGLYGFMNDRTHSTIEVEGAHLTRLQQPARLVARYPRLWMSKREISALLLSTRTEMGPVSMTRHGYSNVIQQWVHVMLAGYELRGAMESPGRLDISGVMTEDEFSFAPIYEAQLQSILFPSIEANSPAVLFNSGAVTAICPLPKDDIPPSSAGTPA